MSSETPESTPPAQPRPSSGIPMMPIGLSFFTVGLSLAVVLYSTKNRAKRMEATEPPKANLAAGAEADLANRQFQPLSKPLQELLNDATYVSVPTQAHPLLGQLAPDFTLQDSDGNAWKLADATAKGPVIVVFYYGYYCDHCVSQLFGLKKDLAKFTELGATIVAISADPVEETRARLKEYGTFGYPVLSDPENQVATRYATFTPAKSPDEEGALMHGTFVIDRAGRIVWANRGDQPFIANQTLLQEIHRRDQAAKSSR
ncbi:peroxiredoxin family protein [Tuwongella immobilis]|uniref:thioredoxin-dependent peroxiredoxin n=1 Tax=Tuwongella immobilis TaxID=692036 RepID=A0A6C2YR73_9BACT|nr:peroxiredoxin family protein [Tuwongella immobilis]VIP03841.1 alkyl hydroperoxide reductase : Alkyl hydroperoxide reductase/ Thiol specific antioxidant/ Mal allergen OS=Planctomyces limnophilus (strain ATCC 43296 / DSM 3776 / IFAM 1008 / 290) GN=Plim_4080 PE=4 SV=1: AhpC-TSA [Tuwongella immobilis]VTS05049.1 alkyl hydroperoxide reductase : Alkyl hydroperoxide reductase/ Thiol specific antioxidant/ Mal allergen OS=Planctomyces limnophilus (strain ATCC 43296 / DSM 3776 / IFAM 1008 / 290) GN=Plim_